MISKPKFPQRIRKKLRRMAHDDERERAKSTLEAAIKHERARLQELHPDAPSEWIERVLALHVAANTKSTPAVIPKPPGIPKAVLEARRAERRKIVAKGRAARCGYTP